MNITSLFDKEHVLPETMAKVLLTENIIEEILKSFSQKTAWEEVKCEQCTDDSLCKRHKIEKYIYNNLTNFVKIDGINVPENLSSVYANKYYLVCFNEETKLMIVINTPSFPVKYEEVTDFNMKKLNIFVYSEITSVLMDTLKDSDKVIDLNVIKDTNKISVSIDKKSNTVLKLLNIYGSYIWDVTN